jgi:hypothetical protein
LRCHKKIGVLYETAEADFDDFLLDFLGEFEAIFKTALACESGPKGGLLDEKSRVENLVILSP